MQTCSLHIQTMAEERAILKNSVISTVIGCHLSKSVNQISSARADHARPFTVKLKGLVKRKTASPPLCVSQNVLFSLYHCNLLKSNTSFFLTIQVELQLMAGV